jgi:hypothetical protein
MTLSTGRKQTALCLRATGSSFMNQEIDMTKLIAALIAATFSLGAFAQASAPAAGKSSTPSAASASAPTASSDKPAKKAKAAKKHKASKKAASAPAA